MRGEGRFTSCAAPVSTRVGVRAVQGGASARRARRGIQAGMLSGVPINPLALSVKALSTLLFGL